MAFAAVILAGGRAARLSGVDKVQLEVAGKTLLRRAIEAVAGAEPIVVVGPRRAVPGVVWTREDPPGSGPVAGLAAGLDALPGGVTEVAVLAGDLLGVRASTVDRLRAAVDAESAGAVLVDAGGVPQWLIGVWRAGPLRAALPAEPAGRSLRAVLGALPFVEVPAEPGEAADVDTPDDLP
ncbi:MAG TPA: molybdenum cofactor guanylyltransferase [Actinophytocola sp.]|uniref:molybdenum cofactor guanylyltransferase n=1 Tax=Actinophytocola sp. TaxID=1872138 RepID=UPI002DDCAFD1|nr:molybdenum cofactor guanylyltransferase [Actinophytocola sp.]HEV2779345.1 molybdenum cofactor guanylyltransferase [Actinophytocola sp.]